MRVHRRPEDFRSWKKIASELWKKQKVQLLLQKQFNELFAIFKCVYRWRRKQEENEARALIFGFQRKQSNGKKWKSTKKKWVVRLTICYLRLVPFRFLETTREVFDLLLGDSRWLIVKPNPLSTHSNDAKSSGFSWKLSTTDANDIYGILLSACQIMILVPTLDLPIRRFYEKRKKITTKKFT